MLVQVVNKPGRKASSIITVMRGHTSVAARIEDWRNKVTLRQWEKVTLPRKCNIFTELDTSKYSENYNFLVSDKFSTMESKFYPRLTNAEAADILRSNTACDKFSLSTQALARKLGRLDDDTAEAINAVKDEVTSTTASIATCLNRLDSPEKNVTVQWTISAQ